MQICGCLHTLVHEFSIRDHSRRINKKVLKHAEVVHNINHTKTIKNCYILTLLSFRVGIQWNLNYLNQNLNYPKSELTALLEYFVNMCMLY